jgi:hypothetical protein
MDHIHPFCLDLCVEKSQTRRALIILKKFVKRNLLSSKMTIRVCSRKYRASTILQNHSIISVESYKGWGVEREEKKGTGYIH